jgi:hypothetical protein
MAITTKGWWNDPKLKDIGIHTRYDPMKDVVQFAHDYENFGRTFRVIVEIDAYRLQYEKFEERDLYKMFDDGARHAPEFTYEGPTTEDLQNPAIRNAWEEFRLVYRLAGGMNDI